jgi:hypothetical protein
MIIAEIALLILSVVRLFVPIGLGYSLDNLYLMVISSVSLNFVLVFAVLLFILLLLHLLTKKTKKVYTDTKTDVVIIVATIIALFLSIL